jgi:hypothetical protein
MKYDDDDDDDDVVHHFAIYDYSTEWHEDLWVINWTYFEGNGGDSAWLLHRHLSERTGEKQDKRQPVSWLGF